MNNELERFYEVIRQLEAGEIRVAEKTETGWKVNSWIKEVILSGFRLGKMTDMSEGLFSFFDKDTLPPRRFSVEDGIRRFQRRATNIRRLLQISKNAFGPQRKASERALQYVEKR